MYSLIAQVADAPKPVIPEMWANILPVALSLVAFALVYLALGPLRSFLTTKIGQNRFGAVAIRVMHLAEVVVQDLEATLAKELKAKAPDGLTTEEIKQLRDAALARLKALLAENGMKELTAALGVLGGAPIDAYLSGVIETAVTKKNADAAATVVATNPNP